MGCIPSKKQEFPEERFSNHQPICNPLSNSTTSIPQLESPYDQIPLELSAYLARMSQEEEDYDRMPEAPAIIPTPRVSGKINLKSKSRSFIAGDNKANNDYRLTKSSHIKKRSKRVNDCPSGNYSQGHVRKKSPGGSHKSSDGSRVGGRRRSAGNSRDGSRKSAGNSRDGSRIRAQISAGNSCNGSRIGEATNQDSSLMILEEIDEEQSNI